MTAIHVLNHQSHFYDLSKAMFSYCPFVIHNDSNRTTQVHDYALELKIFIQENICRYRSSTEAPAFG